MSKNNFKLSLNKQVVSNFNEKKIVGGGSDLCPFETIVWKSDNPGECNWSYWSATDKP